MIGISDQIVFVSPEFMYVAMYIYEWWKLLYLIYSRSGSNGKNTLAVSNSVCDEAHKTEGKTVPHQTTDTGELYAMSTKDTHDEPQLLYTYARVDLDTKRVRFVRSY